MSNERHDKRENGLNAILWHAKTKHLYCEKLVDKFETSEKRVQLIVVFGTVFSSIMLFAKLGTLLNILFLAVIIIAQIITLAYPIAMKYNEKLHDLKVYIVQFKALTTDIIVELRNGEIPNELIKSYETRYFKIDEIANIPSVEASEEQRFMNEALEEAKIYFEEFDIEYLR